MLKFLKDFLVYGMASVFGKIAAIFLMPIYTNVLTKEEYGAMAAITACKGIIDLFSNLNIHSGVARDYYDNQLNRKVLVSTGMWSILFASFIVLIIMLITRDFWGCSVLGLQKKYMLPFTIMLLSIPAGSTMSYFAILTRFEKKPIKFAIGTVIQITMQTLVSIYTVVFLKAGVIGIFLGVLVGEFFGIAYWGWINRKNLGLVYNRIYIKRVLCFSLPALPAILAGWIDSSMGQIMIGKYISHDDLAIYSVALQLASIFTFISIALNNVWGPYLYENYTRKDFIFEVKKIYKLFIYVLIVLSVNVAFLSKEIVTILSNESYVVASRYLTILCIPMCLYLLFPIVNSGISLSRDTKYTGFAYVLGSIFNIMTLCVLMPVYGVISVPCALAISRVVTYFFLYYVSRKKGYIVLPNGLLCLLVGVIFVSYLALSLNLSFLFRICFLIIVDTILLISIAPRCSHIIKCRKKV